MNASRRVAAAVAATAIAAALGGCTAEPHSVFVSWEPATSAVTGQIRKTVLCEPTGAAAYLRSGAAARLEDRGGRLLARGVLERNISTGTCGGGVGFSAVAADAPYVLRVGGHTLRVEPADDSTASVRGSAIGGAADDGTRYYDLGIIP